MKGRIAFLCLLIGLLLEACTGRQVGGEALMPGMVNGEITGEIAEVATGETENQGSSELMRQTLLEYGWPQIIIDAMEPALKEQICRDQVRFYSAQILWYQKDVGRVKEFFYTGYEAGEEDPLANHEIPDYDFCLMLAVGTCYQNGELEHLLCNLNYEWNILPEDRREDSFKVTWDSEVFWEVFESASSSWSQVSNDGCREGLGSELAKDIYDYGEEEWDTHFADADRWGIQGLAGSAWFQLKVAADASTTLEGTVLRGTYMYDKKGLFVHQGYNLDVDLRLILPPLQENDYQ